MNQRVTAVEQKNTEQDTAIAGKVNIVQGSGNAGKTLVVGNDGNVICQNIQKTFILLPKLTVSWSGASSGWGTGNLYTLVPYIPSVTILDENTRLLLFTVTAQDRVSGATAYYDGAISTSDFLYQLSKSLNISSWSEFPNGTYEITAYNGVPGYDNKCVINTSLEITLTVSDNSASAIINSTYTIVGSQRNVDMYIYNFEIA